MNSVTTIDTAYTRQPNHPLTSDKAEGALEGHSVIPRPATGLLTDMQQKKIALVALTVICFIGPVLGGLLLGGIPGLMYGGFLGFGIGLNAAMGAHFNWPRADFQTEKGAAKVRDDLAKMSLQDLQRNYSFDNLAYYGFVSEVGAKKMMSLYKSMPEYGREYSEMDNPIFDRSFYIRLNLSVYKRREAIEREFDVLRHRPDFIQ